MPVKELMITVHTDERLFVELADETHGISKMTVSADGKKGFYVAPDYELAWLNGEAPPPEGSVE